jgi:hypothetical protein
VRDLPTLASGSSDGLSGAFHILRFLQCDERDMDILALCVPPLDGDIAVDEELQDHMDMVRARTWDDRRALERFQAVMCCRLGERTFYDTRFWERGSNVGLSPIQILDVHGRRPLRDVEVMQPNQLSEALVLTMLTCPEPRFQETVDRVLKALIHRNRVGLGTYEWYIFAACVAGGIGIAHVVQWATTTASTAASTCRFQKTMLSALAHGAAASGHDDVFETAVMAINDEVVIDIYHSLFWAPVSHLTKGKAWTDSVIARARAQAAI